jgi:hypothetical protein
LGEADAVSLSEESQCEGNLSTDILFNNAPHSYEHDSFRLSFESSSAAIAKIASFQGLKDITLEEDGPDVATHKAGPNHALIGPTVTGVTRRASQSPVIATSAPHEVYRTQIMTAQLDTYFTTEAASKLAYTDADIREITNLLRQHTPKWGRAPRTYIVFRTIDSLDLLDACLAVGFSDYWFPVTQQSLPDFLPSNVRQAFVEAQSQILTKSMDLEKGDLGEHCYFESGEALPLERKGILGKGAYGQVDKVLSLISFREYARKRVLRSTIFRGRKKEDVTRFVAEIEILKRLKHDHVVKFVGSYTDAKYIGLIMTPIADGDLAAYLAGITTSK